MNLKLDTMINVRKRLFNLILIAFGCIFLIILLLNISFPVKNINDNNKIDYNPLVLITTIIGTVLGIMLLINMKNFIYNLGKPRLIAIAMTCFIIIAAIQTVFIKNFSIITYVDEKHLYAAAIDIKNGTDIGNMWYFSNWYPFQLPITLIMSGIFKVCDFLYISDYKLVLSIVNTVLIDFAIFLLFKTVKKVYCLKKAVIVLLLFAFNPFIYIYSIYFYTDMPAIFLIVLSQYLYCTFNNSKNPVIKYSSLVLLGVFAFIGCKIRATVIFIILAVLVHMLFKGRIKEFMKSAAIIAVIFALGSVGYKQIEKQYIKEDIVGLPPIHWIHMGMNLESYGYFNGEDRKFALQYDTAEERKEAIYEDLLTRVENNGVDGTARLLFIKIGGMWTKSADFYPQSHMEYYNDNLYPFIFGQKSVFLVYYGQIYKSILFFMVFMSLFYLKKESYQNIDFMNAIYLLGVFVFYLFWEVKARYILMAYPALILLGANGLESISHKVNNMIVNKSAFYNNQKTRFKRIIRAGLSITMIVLPIITLIISSINYNAYTEENTEQYSWIAKQDQSMIFTDKVLKGDEVAQTFIADKNFNTIELYVVKSQGTTSAAYIITLRDILNNKEIEKWQISTDDISENKIKLKFNEVNIPKNSKNEYSIIITTDDATEDNALKIQAYYYHNYDVFPTGSLTLNRDSLSNTDLTFKVYNYWEAPLMKKSNYIIFTLIVLITELLTFKSFQKKLEFEQP